MRLCFHQPAPVSKFIQGYLGAVTSAVSIAVSTSALSEQVSDSWKASASYENTLSKGSQV